jgi:histidinol-phosphate aminotransferase
LKVKEQLLTLSPYKPGKPIEEVKREFNLDRVVKLASNENPYGSSALVKEAIAAEIENMALYPDGYAAELRAAVAKHVGVEQDQLIFGNGSDEVKLFAELCYRLIQILSCRRRHFLNISTMP